MLRSALVCRLLPKKREEPADQGTQRAKQVANILD